jgi:hypothetical protein
MSDLFHQPAAATKPDKLTVQQFFVDEAGTPTLFHEPEIQSQRPARRLSHGMDSFKWRFMNEMKFGLKLPG